MDRTSRLFLNSLLVVRPELTEGQATRKSLAQAGLFLLNPYGVSMGGDDEAWYCRQETLALWEQLGALTWLRSCAKAIGARG